MNNIGTATTNGIRRQVAGNEANNIVGLYDMNGIIAGMQVRVSFRIFYAPLQILMQ